MVGGRIQKGVCRIKDTIGNSQGVCIRTGGIDAHSLCVVGETVRPIYCPRPNPGQYVRQGRRSAVANDVGRHQGRRWSRIDRHLVCAREVA